MWCFCKESLDGMDGISTDLPFGVLVPIWQGKEGIYPSCLHPDFVPDDAEQGYRSTPNRACGTGPVRDVFADAVLGA